MLAEARAALEASLERSGAIDEEARPQVDASARLKIDADSLTTAECALHVRRNARLELAPQSPKVCSQNVVSFEQTRSNTTSTNLKAAIAAETKTCSITIALRTRHVGCLQQTHKTRILKRT